MGFKVQITSCWRFTSLYVELPTVLQLDPKFRWSIDFGSSDDASNCVSNNQQIINKEFTLQITPSPIQLTRWFTKYTSYPKNLIWKIFIVSRINAHRVIHDAIATSWITFKNNSSFYHEFFSSFMHICHGQLTSTPHHCLRLFALSPYQLHNIIHKPSSQQLCSTLKAPRGFSTSTNESKRL